MSSHAPVVPAASRPQHTDLDLVAWMRRHARLHLDIGTGDGKYALHVARRCPDTAVVGLDTSLDHLRGAKRRYPANLRFLQRDACRPLDGGLPVAADVTINFPYGRLLSGLVEGDTALLALLDATVGDRLVVRVNRTAFVATGLDPERGPAAILCNLRRIGGLVVTIRELDQAELRSFPSTWAKRLGFGREAGALTLEGTRR